MSFLGQFDMGIMDETAQYLYFYFDNGAISVNGPYISFMADNANSQLKIFYMTPAGAIALKSIDLEENVFVDSVTEL